MNEPLVLLIDDDDAFRESLCRLLGAVGYRTRAYASARAFLERLDSAELGCLLVDLRMPDLGGLELQAALKGRGFALPIVFVSGHGDIQTAVRAIKLGAFDFIEKPFHNDDLVGCVKRALDHRRAELEATQHQRDAAALYASLTEREREVFHHLVDGKMNKVIAHELSIAERTVEFHRANIMQKMRANSLADLIRYARDLA